MIRINDVLQFERRLLVQAKERQLQDQAFFDPLGGNFNPLDDSLTLFRLDIYHAASLTLFGDVHLGTCRISVEQLRLMLPSFPKEEIA